MIPHLLSNLLTSEKILYSNAKNLSILAFSGGHGSISSLENVDNGIEIWMRQMNRVVIDPDGTTVTVGGGAKSKEIAKTLNARGKRTGLRALQYRFPANFHSHWRL